MIHMYAVVVCMMECVGSNQERNRLGGNVLFQEMLVDWVDVSKSLRSERNFCLPLPTWRAAVYSPSVQLYFKRVVSFIDSYIFLGHFPDCRSLILRVAWILSLCLSVVLIQESTVSSVPPLCWSECLTVSFGYLLNPKIKSSVSNRLINQVHLRGHNGDINGLLHCQACAPIKDPCFKF